MKVELVVIGDEVLAGHTVNTNAAFIGKALARKGYTISRQTTLPDEAEILREGLRSALQRSDIVISTGGLGPTVDDITRNIVAELFDSDFHFDENVGEDLEHRFGKNLPTLQNQATVPIKAEVFINTIGTAPGMVLSNEMGALLMLPGVPNEMEPMFLEQAIPYLLKHFPLKEHFFYKMVNLFDISEFSVDPFLRELKGKYPDIEFGIYSSLGTLSLQLSTYAEEKETAMRRIDIPRSEIEMKFASNCFESESGKLEETVRNIFVENQWTLSIAESCTGGSASATLTQSSGASEYFLGAIVSYANFLKTDFLGVPESVIKDKGVVSEEVVVKMVEGVIDATGSDFGLAVSGIAGPTGGTSQKSVGTVWCAVCRRGEKPHTWKLQARGTRQMIITRSVNSLLSNLLLYTKETSLL